MSSTQLDVAQPTVKQPGRTIDQTGETNRAWAKSPTKSSETGRVSRISQKFPKVHRLGRITRIGKNGANTTKSNELGGVSESPYNSAKVHKLGQITKIGANPQNSAKFRKGRLLERLWETKSRTKIQQNPTMSNKTEYFTATRRTDAPMDRTHTRNNHAEK
jgi:hypothetical protein